MKNSATIAPLMTKPRTAASRSRLRTTPSRLRMKPAGAAVITVSPPRAVMGDPQPGLHSHMTASAPRAASEQHRPIRPNPAFRGSAGSAWITGGSFIIRLSEFHLDRPAGGLQRFEVELDVDGDFLANQIFGYSP
jgi:hypothetical protein